MYAFVADLTIFHLSFVALELAGAAIITACNFFTIWYKMKYAPEEESDSTMGIELKERRYYQLDQDSDDSDDGKRPVVGMVTKGELRNDW